MTFDANGYVGAIQMTLLHGDDFSIALTDDALVSDFNTEDNKTTLIVVNPETTDLFTTTGAFKALSLALPELDGKLTGNAIRVPTPNVSLAILSLSLDKSITTDVVNEYLRGIAFHSKYREIIGFVNSPEIVSTDFYSSSFASVIDSQATIVSDKRLTLYCWYDNEYGYTKQVLNLTRKVASIDLQRFPKAIEDSV